MKRGQVRTAIVVFGLVFGIALVGMLLLIIKPGIAGFNIGETYGRGISQQTPLPRYVPGGPTPEFPAGPSSTIGSRTPIMILFRGTQYNIIDSSMCWSDFVGKMADPQSAFSCYVVPTSTPEKEATGWYWPTQVNIARPLGDIGGDVYCYENTPYNRTQMLSHMHAFLPEEDWDSETVNGEEVMICKKPNAYHGR